MSVLGAWRRWEHRGRRQRGGYLRRQVIGGVVPLRARRRMTSGSAAPPIRSCCGRHDRRVLGRPHHGATGRARTLESGGRYGGLPAPSVTPIMPIPSSVVTTALIVTSVAVLSSASRHAGTSPEESARPGLVAVGLPAVAVIISIPAPVAVLMVAIVVAVAPSTGSRGAVALPRLSLTVDDAHVPVKVLPPHISWDVASL